MSKKKIIIIAVSVVVVIAACIGGCVYFDHQNKQKILDSISLEFNDLKEIEYGSDVKIEDLVKNVEGKVIYPKLDMSKLGKQTLVFKVTKEGQEKTFDLTINVVDKTAPVITLTKEKETLKVQDKIDIKSYIKSVQDNYDSDLEYKDMKDVKEDDSQYYTYQSDVQTEKAGTYSIKVIAVDSSHNKTEKTISIVVEAKEEVVNPPVSNSGSPTYSPNKNNKVIVINAGHQGSGNSSKEAIGPGSSVMKAKVSSGATGVSSRIPESKTTLAVALKLRSELQARGYTVVMTRTSQNVNISNKERAEIGNNNNASAVISIHCDGNNNASVRGAHTIAPKKGNKYNPEIYSASSSLAQKVISSYCNETGIEPRKTSVVYRDDLTGLNWSKVPAIYIEMGFISNVTEDGLLNDSSFQDKCAKGIANGLDNYYR